MSSKDEFYVISTGAIVQVTEVRFYTETVNHIAESHPEVKIELPSLMEAVSNAISTPTIIERSHTNSYVFIDHGSTNFKGDPLKVPVKVVEGTSGVVKTAFFSESNSPANVLYRKPDGER